MEGKEQNSFLWKNFFSGTNKISTPIATKDHPSDKAIIFLQDLFESHRKDLKALQNSTEAQELIIKLLKIPNEEKTQDTYEHGVNSLCDEVQFKSLCDLMSIQTWQVRCAVNGFEKLTNWLCNAIEISKTNLPSTWMTLNEQLKRTNHHTLTDSKSTTTSTKAVKENIDAIQRVIAEMNEKYKHARLEQKQSKTDDDRQDYDNNDNYQVLKDDVDKLKETNSQLKSYISRYEKDVRKRLDIKDNRKQQIDEWKKTKEKVQSATLVESLNQQLDVSQLSDQRPPPSTDDNYENETQVSTTAKAEKNKTSFEVHHDDRTVMSTTINAPKTKDGLLEVQNGESLNQPLDVSQPNFQSTPPSADKGTNETKKPESGEAKAESNRTHEQTEPTSDNLYDNMAGGLQHLFEDHLVDVRLMLTTINALKIMVGLQKAQKVNCNKYVDENTQKSDSDDFSTLKDMMSIHEGLLTCVEKIFLTTEILFFVAKDELKTPATQDGNIPPIPPTDSEIRTTGGKNMQNMIDTVQRVHDAIDQMYTGRKCDVKMLRTLLEELREYIKRYENYKNELEQRKSKLEHELKDKIEKPKNETNKSKKQTVTLQLYHTRKDDVMMKVLDELDYQIKQRFLKKYNVIIVHCDTPGLLNPNIPVLVLCINASRLTHDVEAATAGISIKDLRHAALIVFYHIDVNVAPLQKGSIAGNFFGKIVYTHHMAFLCNEGIYECKENTDALNDIVSFIKGTTRRA